MANVWRDVSQQPIVTIASGASIKVIADSTRCLQQCVQEQLRHLDNRARVLATCAHFEAALRDAITMQELAPTLAAGYLCAGHVCSFQGREKAAIEIYDKGLAVVPLSDPSHQQLLDTRSMAQEKDSKCIDFISEFPLDIIEHIAPKILSAEEMAPSELEEYLGVSRVWREKLLLGVQELHIESASDNDLGHSDDLLEQVAPYCTALTLYRKAIGFTRLMSKVQFKSLHTLVLYTPYGDEEFNDTEIPKKTLASLPFLTHLTIRTHYYNINLSDILNTCPNLVYLQADNRTDDMSTAPERHPRLKALLLWEDDAEIDFPEITKRLPALQVFSANPLYYSEHLKVVQDNCPYLKVLGFNDHREWYGYVPTISSGDDHNTAGVHTLYIDYYDMNWLLIRIKDIMNFMIRNRHTMRDIYFNCPLPCPATEENDPSGTPILSHAIHATDDDNYDDRFNQMANYTQEIGDQNHLLMARWVARKSPHLKQMELEWMPETPDVDIDTSALFDDLIGLCELESVTINLATDSSMDMGGIERFIQYHSTFDSHLHTFTLPNDIRLHHDTLNLLATLPRLKHLSIGFPLVKDEEDDPDGEHFSQFIHQLAVGCPQLEHLEISFYGPIHDNIFLRLSELQVTSLELGMRYYEDKLPIGLLSLLQCPHLQVLDINVFWSKDKPFSDTIRNMLKSTIDVHEESSQ
ncbi:hypothetical protein K492DRAFT_209006 [Lichtheimia hyalospora FSU 10163]|nr:hypothetical protein K492DRAFT_209006 [Lichtheimia hyalospora FSU 10163]